ncbi:MAG: sodium-dependent transporter [Marinilabiliaceae bacterium]|nr:sodium-dependent transporter [Marinilabiliaceae bacterium]
MSHEGFGSKIGAIAAAAGSAVGLGNIWRFPYVTGENGGAAFLLVYIAFTLIIALPVLMSEFAIGRTTGKPVTDAFRSLAPKGKWYLIGFSGVVCAFVILSFYNVVAGWTLYYTYLSITGALNNLSPAEVTQTFNNTLSDPATCIIWMLVMMGMTGYVVARGVSEGIEKYSKILMPILLVLIILICVRSLSLDTENKGIKFLLSPDFSKLTPRALVEALGQAFFSLSLGMGTMTTYGAYISKKQNLAKCATSVAIIDFMVAFLAGLMIFPCAFAFGVNPGSGPGLVFETLPNVFNQMPMGQVMAIGFFTLLVVAAVTSSISILEVLASYFMTKLNIGRKRATVFSILLSIGFGIGCSVFPTMLDFFDNLSANILLPLGAFFIILFVPLKVGPERMRNEMEAHGGKFTLFPCYYFLAKYIVPWAILFIFISKILPWLGINAF